MLVLKVIYFTLFSIVVQSVPYAEIDIDFLGSDLCFVSEISEKLDAFNDDISNISELGAMEYVGEVAGKGVNYLQNSTRMTSEMVLIRSIANRTDMKEAVKLARKTKDEISDIINLLKDINKTEHDLNIKRQKIIKIHNIINKRLDIFMDNELYKKYPFLTLPTLFTLSGPITIVVNNIALKAAKDDINDSKDFFACKLKDVLIYFRHAVTLYRLSKLVAYDVVNGEDVNEHEPNYASAVLLNRPYDRRGYNDMEDSNVTFDNIGCEPIDYLIAKEPKNRFKYHYYCLRDTVTQGNFAVYDEEKEKDCYVGYCEILRTRIEKAFQKPLDLLGDVCQTTRNATGYGWWTLTINSAITKTLFNSTSLCDGVVYLVFGRPSSCDPYVQVKIGGEKVYETKKIYLTQADKQKAFFFETYHSEKINKKSNISIQVLDYDRRPWGADDLVIDFNPKLSQISDKVPWELKQGENSLFFASLWIDEFESEED